MVNFEDSDVHCPVAYLDVLLSVASNFYVHLSYKLRIWKRFKSIIEFPFICLKTLKFNSKSLNFLLLSFILPILGFGAQGCHNTRLSRCFPFLVC
jgi:hypothetical protein